MRKCASSNSASFLVLPSAYGQDPCTDFHDQYVKRRRFITKDDITSQDSDILAMCFKVISSFVIFAVLDLRVADLVFKRRCKLLSFFTIIFAVFLHDLSFAYQISSKRNHSQQSYDVIKNCGHMELEIHPRLWFSNSTRLAMFTSLSKPNFDKIVRTKLCYYYFWFEKTDFRHIGIILPVSIWPIDRHGYCILHWRTKFKVSRSNSSRDMEGVPKFPMQITWPLPHPLWPNITFLSLVPWWSISLPNLIFLAPTVPWKMWE